MLPEGVLAEGLDEAQGPVVIAVGEVAALEVARDGLAAGGEGVVVVLFVVWDDSSSSSSSSGVDDGGPFLEDLDRLVLGDGAAADAADGEGEGDDEEEGAEDGVGEGGSPVGGGGGSQHGCVLGGGGLSLEYVMCEMGKNTKKKGRGQYQGRGGDCYDIYTRLAALLY